MRSLSPRQVLAACAVFAAVLALPSHTLAQAGPAASAGPCKVVADTAVVPTREQVMERQQLRLSLDSIAKQNGVAEPSAILFVDVDTTRRGNVIFIDSNLSPQATQAATRRVEEYLTTLAAGRGYQALIRLDADYVAPAPGKRSCSPVLENGDELSDLMQAVIQRHPQSGRRPAPETKRAVVRLVVNRRGTVSYAEVVQPTGDAFIDQFVQPIAEHLRFSPATLDDVPYDVRFRFTMTFTLR
ncbi:MAG TPA: energy transducer TonB [Longimicrobium sp.]|jgi:TonB family protein